MSSKIQKNKKEKRDKNKRGPNWGNLIMVLFFLLVIIYGYAFAVNGFDLFFLVKEG
jgi:hypothetical protein